MTLFLILTWFGNKTVTCIPLIVLFSTFKLQAEGSPYMNSKRIHTFLSRQGSSGWGSQRNSISRAWWEFKVSRKICWDNHINCDRHIWCLRFPLTINDIINCTSELNWIKPTYRLTIKWLSEVFQISRVMGVLGAKGIGVWEGRYLKSNATYRNLYISPPVDVRLNHATHYFLLHFHRLNNVTQ